MTPFVTEKCRCLMSAHTASVRRRWGSARHYWSIVHWLTTFILVGSGILLVCCCSCCWGDRLQKSQKFRRFKWNRNEIWRDCFFCQVDTHHRSIESWFLIWRYTFKTAAIQITHGTAATNWKGTNVWASLLQNVSLYELVTSFHGEKCCHLLTVPTASAACVQCICSNVH